MSCGNMDEVKRQLREVQQLLQQEEDAHQHIMRELEWMRAQLTKTTDTVAEMGDPNEVHDAAETISLIKKRAAVAAGFAAGLGVTAGASASDTIRNALHKLIDLLGGV